MSKRFQLTIDSTKQSEINALRKLARKVRGDTYLAGLFTDEMVEWCEIRIKQDFLPDLFGHWESQREKAEGLGDHVRHQAQAIERLEEASQRSHEEHRLEVERLKGQLEAAKETAAKQADQAERWRREYLKVDGLRAEITAEVQNLEDELVEVKAKLYDLTNGGE